MRADGARISRFGEYRGYSSPEFDGWRRFSQHVTVRDGTRIAIDYYRPTRAGELHPEPLPVVWSFNRYQRSNLSGGELYTTFHQHPPLLDVMQHGYVLGNADVRGSGASYGSKHGWFPPEEAEDACDVTEWFAAQPWCNGRIGMARRSYLGITQYFNASQSPPHLACIFPGVAFIDEYDFIYPGGIFLDWPVYCWAGAVEAADRSAALPPDWRESRDAQRVGSCRPGPLCTHRVRGRRPRRRRPRRSRGPGRRGPRRQAARGSHRRAPGEHERACHRRGAALPRQYRCAQRRAIPPAAQRLSPPSRDRALRGAGLPPRRVVRRLHARQPCCGSATTRTGRSW